MRNVFKTLAISSGILGVLGLEVGFALRVVVDVNGTTAGVCGTLGGIFLVNALLAWVVWDLTK